MILGIGIDAVEIARFEKWHTYSKKKLLRIFSEQEIDYCLAVPVKSAERFAARFAAKEAVFKALSQAKAEKKFNFFHISRHCQVIKKETVPIIQINWWALNLPAATVLVSITHTQTDAYAQVVIVT